MTTTNLSTSTGEFAVYGVTLVASTVDTVNFDQNRDQIRVHNDSGTAAIHFTVDGSTPTAGGKKTFRVPAFAGAYLDVSVPGGAGTEVVKLISSGTPTYSVVGV